MNRQKNQKYNDMVDKSWLVDVFLKSLMLFEDDCGILWTVELCFFETSNAGSRSAKMGSL